MAKKKVVLDQDEKIADLSGYVYTLTSGKSAKYDKVQTLEWASNGDNTFSKGEFVMQPSYSINGVEYHVTNQKGETEVFESLTKLWQYF